MHEATLAEGILKIVLTTAKENNAAKISEVGLIIGDMAGVELSALEFSFGFLAKHTAADGAKLTVEKKPLIGKCTSCGKETRLEEYNFFCPLCKEGVLEIISGRQMQVAYVEAE